jgi:hypothetical protein
MGELVMDGGAVGLALPGTGPALGVASSLTGRAWSWRPYEERQALAMAQRIGVPELVGRVLSARGVGVDEAADFLVPTMRALLPDPALLADMDIAATRLADAVRSGETVAIFGDYDVDGACSAALLTLFLRGLGCALRAGPDGRGLWAERAGTAWPGGARRDTGGVRGLRHRGRGGACRAFWPGGGGCAGPP